MELCSKIFQDFIHFQGQVLRFCGQEVKEQTRLCLESLLIMEPVTTMSNNLII